VQTPQDLVTFYDARKAQKFPTGSNPENDAVVRKALRALRLRRGDVLLDFGCADGYFTRRLADAVAGVRAIGFDLVNHDAWEVARSENVRFFSGTPPTALGPASVDAIFCSQVLEHVPDPSAVALEFQRVLKPGGRVWLATPNSYDHTARVFHGLQRHIDSVEGHLRHFSAAEIKRLFSPAGFEINAVRYDTYFALFFYYRFIAYSPLKAMLMPMVAPEIASKRESPSSEALPMKATILQNVAKAGAFSLMRGARAFDDLFSWSPRGQIIEVTMTRAGAHRSPD
jgi:SAM-dependent methyltransferase